MFISTESWHGKIYRWWWKSKYEMDCEPSHANLCPYVRRVLFRAPFRWLLIAGQVGAIHTACISWPILVLSPLFLRWEIGLAYGVVLLTSATAGAIITGVLATEWFFQNSRAGRSFSSATKEKAASFRYVVAAALKPLHDRICPDLQFREPRA